MTKELEDIISSVTTHMDVTKYDLINGHTHADARARGCICHIIKDGFIHLKKEFLEHFGMTRAAFTRSVISIENMIEYDREIRSRLNRVRADFALPVIKDDCLGEVVEEGISATKRMFGFDYTEIERLRFKRFADESDAFWDKLTSYGRPPMQDGMVFQPEAKTNHKS